MFEGRIASASTISDSLGDLSPLFVSVAAFLAYFLFVIINDCCGTSSVCQVVKDVNDSLEFTAPRQRSVIATHMASSLVEKLAVHVGLLDQYVSNEIGVYGSRVMAEDDHVRTLADFQRTDLIIA